MPYKDIQKRREFQRKRYKERKAGAPPKPSVKKTFPVKCAYCGKEFYRSPANQSCKNNYCSRNCMAKAFIGRVSPKKKEQTRLCNNCGKQITRPT